MECHFCFVCLYEEKEEPIFMSQLCHCVVDGQLIRSLLQPVCSVFCLQEDDEEELGRHFDRSVPNKVIGIESQELFQGVAFFDSYEVDV